MPYKVLVPKIKFSGKETLIQAEKEKSSPWSSSSYIDETKGGTEVGNNVEEEVPTEVGIGKGIGGMSASEPSSTIGSLSEGSQIHKVLR